MKKYDFYLLGLYVVIFLVALFVVVRLNYYKIAHRDEVNKLLSQKIERIEIINTQTYIDYSDINRQIKVKTNWFMNGMLKSYEDLQKIKVVDNVLYIEGLNPNNYINLYIDNSIEVNITNSPNVKNHKRKR